MFHVEHPYILLSTAVLLLGYSHHPVSSCSHSVALAAFRAPRLLPAGGMFHVKHHDSTHG